MRRAVVAAVSLLAGLVLMALAAPPAFADVAPSVPVLVDVQTSSCTDAHAVLTASREVLVSVLVEDPDDASVTVALQLYNADHTRLLGHLRGSIAIGFTVGFLLHSTEPFQSGAHYAVRGFAADRQYRSNYSNWCTFRVDNRIPTVPTQSSATFGTGSPLGQVGTPGRVTVSGGGPAATRYQWNAGGGYVFSQTCGGQAEFGTLCTHHGAAVTFGYTPLVPTFRICVRAMSVTGLVSHGTCQTYLVNPLP